MIAVQIEVNVTQGGITWHGEGWWEGPPYGGIHEMLADSIHGALWKGLKRRIDVGQPFDIKIKGESWTPCDKHARTIQEWEKGRSLDGENRFHWQKVAVETWGTVEGD